LPEVAIEAEGWKLKTIGGQVWFLAKLLICHREPRWGEAISELAIRYWATRY